MNDDEPMQMPIDGVLDLHTFRPNEIGELVPDYLAACQQAGILEVRIIHGKGTGALRERVAEMLKKDTRVKEFRLGAWNEGGAGVTLAEFV